MFKKLLLVSAAFMAFSIAAPAMEKSAAAPPQVVKEAPAKDENTATPETPESNPAVPEPEIERENLNDDTNPDIESQELDEMDDVTGPDIIEPTTNVQSPGEPVVDPVKDDDEDWGDEKDDDPGADDELDAIEDGDENKKDEDGLDDSSDSDEEDDLDAIEGGGDSIDDDGDEMDISFDDDELEVNDDDGETSDIEPEESDISGKEELLLEDEVLFEDPDLLEELNDENDVDDEKNAEKAVNKKSAALKKKIADKKEQKRQELEAEAERLAQERRDALKKQEEERLAKAQAEAEKKKLHESRSTNEKIGRAIMFYLPNRLVDISDIFSMGMGFGPEVKLDVRLTGYANWGGFYGDKYFVSKGYDRRIGGGTSTGWAWNDTIKTNEFLIIEDSFGGVENIFYDTDGKTNASPDLEIYKNHDRDFWACGVGIGWLMPVNFDIHPVEVADAILGFFMVDISEDDWK